MRRQTTPPRRKALSRLLLEQLEGRTLLSGLTSHLDVRLSASAGDDSGAPAVVRAVGAPEARTSLPAPGRVEAAFARGPASFGVEAVSSLTHHTRSGLVEKLAHHLAKAYPGERPERTEHDHTPGMGRGRHGEEDFGSWDRGEAGWARAGHWLRRVKNSGQETDESREPARHQLKHSERALRSADRAEEGSSPEDTGAGGEQAPAVGPLAGLEVEHREQARGTPLGPELVRLWASELGDAPEETIARELRTRFSHGEPTAAAPDREEAPPGALPQPVAASAPGAASRQGDPGGPGERAAALLQTLFADPSAGRGGWWGWLSAGYESPAGERAGSPRGSYHFTGGEPLAADQVALAPAPGPAEAGLAAGGLDLDATALQQAVRELLAGLDAAGRELTRALGQNGWARWVVAATLAAAAAEAGRRRLQRDARPDGAARDADTTLSQLSGPCPFPGGEI
jgi:hypothetical protein